MKISVLIPCHNSAGTIGETLQSLQDNTAIGLIQSVLVVDDASSDGSARVAQEAWSSSIPLKVETNSTNLGWCRSTNLGLEILFGSSDWVFILHSDDVVKPNWIKLYADAMLGLPPDVGSLCSSYDVWWADEGRLEPGEDCGEPVYIRPGAAQAVDTFRSGCWWHISGAAIRKAAFCHIGGFDPDLPQMGDWDWVLRSLLGGFGFLYIPRTTQLYRQHSRSVSTSSLREARDVIDQLTVGEKLTAMGVISSIDLQRMRRSALLRLSRRAAVRFIRRDMYSLLQHIRLFGQTARSYWTKSHLSSPGRYGSNP